MMVGFKTTRVRNNEKVIIEVEGRLFVFSPFQDQYLDPAIIFVFLGGIKVERDTDLVL